MNKNNSTNNISKISSYNNESIPKDNYKKPINSYRKDIKEKYGLKDKGLKINTDHLDYNNMKFKEGNNSVKEENSNKSKENDIENDNIADKETIEKNALYNNKVKLKVKPVDKRKKEKDFNKNNISEKNLNSNKYNILKDENENNKNIKKENTNNDKNIINNKEKKNIMKNEKKLIYHKIKKGNDKNKKMQLIDSENRDKNEYNAEIKKLNNELNRIKLENEKYKNKLLNKGINENMDVDQNKIINELKEAKKEIQNKYDIIDEKDK
jgi:hypothetical protein